MTIDANKCREHKMVKNLFVGTSGWSYKHWKGIFYPEKIKPNEYLEFYSSNFECVELNSSFYHLPKPEVVKGWKERTPEDFIFCPKMSRWITHRRKLESMEDSIDLFFDRIKLFKEKLGIILIQFPPTLQFEFNRIHPFFQLLKKKYKKNLFAIEPRHESWICDEVLDYLKDMELTWVISDSGGRYPTCVATTTNEVYLRFHGPDQLYASSYSKRQLKQYVDLSKQWLSEGKRIWVFFNNDSMGYAVRDAKRFSDEFAEK